MQWKVRLCIQVQIIFLLDYNVCIHAEENHDDYGVDVSKLASLTEGTELVVLENAIHNQKTYRLEDFFWTGSGDGSDEDDWNPTNPTTIYSTKTVLSTVYMTSTPYSNQTHPSSTPCVIDCETVTHRGDINPTPTIPPDEEDELNADRQFWLLTVLKSDGIDPDITELKKSLANLYRKAFLRQQANHLKISARTKREAKPDKPINVYIHKMDKSPINGDEKIEVIYHVAVSGQPVDAATAAADMKLVTDAEVKDELGYPFLIKAEPYIKPATSQELAKAKPMWIFIGLSSVIILLLILAIIFLSVCLTKRKHTMGTDNKQQIFEGSGQDNKAFEDEKKGYKSGRRNQNPSPTYINFRSQPSNQTLTSGVNLGGRPHSAISSGSSSSGSFDISPLMGLGKQRTSAKRHVRPKAAINKTTPLILNRHSNTLSVVDTDSSSLANSPDTIFIGNCDPGVVSPKSYLSMPSVKSFPRSNNPEPLNKVLEPVSVMHLDMGDDSNDEQQARGIDYRMFARHGSVGATEDPGIIGPLVWNMHQHRLQHGVSVDEGMDEIKLGSSVSKMRKRFHDLLDDTFSLFGSRRESPIKEIGTNPIEVKSHLDKSYDDLPSLKERPKTSDPKKTIASTSDPRKGAWTSKAPSPLVRPISAPFVRPNTAPKIDVNQVLAQSSLHQNDPAIPLIAAIKKEIGKCSLPGSTTNIHE